LDYIINENSYSDDKDVLPACLDSLYSYI